MQFFIAMRGVLFSSLYILNLLFFSIITGLIGLIVWIVPWKLWRQRGTPILLKFPNWWMAINRLLMRLATGKKWRISGQAELSLKQWYLLLCNHQSWFDILVLGSFFNYKIPLIKFFMKKELLWTLPIAGVVCYFIGYPFMRRHTASEIKQHPELRGKDIETTKKACEKFKELPTTIMIFAEGTRFSEKKRLHTHSPYRHLLKPKAAGAAIVLNEMSSYLAGIINVTLDYSVEHLSMWQFMCGRFDYIYLHYELLPVSKDLLGDFSQDRDYRRHFHAWINKLWQEKDLLLENIRNAKNNSDGNTP